MKKTIILLTSIIVIYIILGNYISNKMDNDYIRIRVIANSDSSYDQKIKYEVSSNVLKYLDTKISDKKNKNSYREIITNSIDDLSNVIGDTLSMYDLEQSFKISYGYNFFPKKKYKNKIYSEGYYESLYIVLGEGLGENFWCLLFPPFCFSEASNNDVIEYTTLSKEIFNFVEKNN